MTDVHTGPVSRRQERMAEQLKEEIASFLIKGNKNPKIGFVTITYVKLTADMQLARVYYSAFGTPNEVAESREGLEESAGAIRSHLAKNLRLRYIPKIEFHFDEGLENSLRVQSLLGELEHPQKEDEEE